jgi:mRNA-degrading endonuclease RelE of RelBE toxin-antitoxin system
VSDNAAMRAIFSRSALRKIPDLPKRDREALVAKIASFAADPFHPAIAVEPMKGWAHAVRIRQGDWRAVCRIDRTGDAVIVELIGNRKDIYR